MIRTWDEVLEERQHDAHTEYTRARVPQAPKVTWEDEIARLTDSEPATNRPPERVICAWCPDFVADLTRNDSHGICPECSARMSEEIDRIDSSKTSNRQP
jgi:hypothetical protein